jgi:hypothetical protein
MLAGAWNCVRGEAGARPRQLRTPGSFNKARC